MRKFLVLFLLVLVGVTAGPLPAAHALAKQSRIIRGATPAAGNT